MMDLEIQSTKATTPPGPSRPLSQVALVEAERLKLGVFARQVAAMRESQRQYFKLIAIAKKTRTKDAFREAHEELTRSKNLEALVDHATFNILNPPTKRTLKSGR